MFKKKTESALKKKSLLETGQQERKEQDEKRILVNINEEMLSQTNKLSKEFNQMGKPKQNFAKAQMGARRLYLDRDPASLFCYIVNDGYSKNKSRHLLRFVATTAAILTTEEIQNSVQEGAFLDVDIMDTMIHGNSSDKTNSAFLDVSKTPIPSFYIHGAENVLCTIMEEARCATEWWVYIHTPRAVNTRRITDALRSMWNLKGTFYTDEFPEGVRTKRQTFNLLQHFRFCLEQIRQQKQSVLDALLI